MIAFIGSSCWDTTLQLKSGAEGDVQRIKERYENPGGNAPNAAAVAAAEGSRVSLITGLGNDHWGDKIKEAFESRGISLCLNREARTKQAYIVLRGDGREILVDQYTNAGFSPSQEAAENIRGADIIDFYPKMLGDFFSEWYDLAKNKIRATSGIYLQEEIKSRRRWEIITESKALISRPTEKDLETVGAQLFVYTDGARGGEWWSPESGWNAYSACRAKPEKGDSTGAGDAFRGGLLHALDSQKSKEEAVLVAAEAAARVVSQKGSLIHL